VENLLSDSRCNYLTFTAAVKKCEHKIIGNEEIPEIVIGKSFSQGGTTSDCGNCGNQAAARATLLFHQALRDVFDLFLNSEIPADQ